MISFPGRASPVASVVAILVVGLYARAAIAAPLKVERMAFETGAKAAQPSVTVDPDAGFVITWQERNGDESALRYAVLDPQGREQRRGLVSSGPKRFVNSADFPGLVVLDNGDWVTFWLEKTSSGTYAYEIRTVRSRDQGRHWDAPVVVHHDATPTEHGFVSMVPAGGGRVRLVWLDGRKMAAMAGVHGESGDEHMTLRSAILARDGALSDEKELDALTCACCQTDMARGLEQTVAVYRDRSAKEIRDISAIAFDTQGASAPRPVHQDGWTMAGCPVNGPALAVRGKRFLAVWPTMAKGPMEVLISIGENGAFDVPRTLGKGNAETGRVDAVTFGDGWLVSRVSAQQKKLALNVTRLADSGAPMAEQTVAAAVGGYPRMAAYGAAALLVFTEPKEQGDSTVAVLRLRQR